MMWRIYRQDDNGNVFEVAHYVSEAAALEAAERFESQSHKQMYWVEEDPPPSRRWPARA
jgi:hypothetical protein